MLRYLFGPIPATAAAQKLAAPRRSGQCLAFHQEHADIVIAPGDDWPSVRARFPAGWQPDFLVLDLAYSQIPACLERVPIPIVGLAADWNLLWHYYLRQLPGCELVLTDLPGVEALRKEGIGHARPANLFGCERAHVEGSRAQVVRDIDILFVGNFNSIVQRERLPWLGRLARLTDRRHVVLTGNVYDAAYRHLLDRARIVFNRSIRGEGNLRVFEAVAAGALLFQEAGNREVPAYFRDRQECVYYHDGNLEALLEYYLDHEDQRRAIAEAARARIGEFTFERLWQQQVERIEADWPALRERVALRPTPEPAEELLTRTLQLLCSSAAESASLGDALTALNREQPSADLANALGLVVSKSKERGEPYAPAQAAVAAEHFRAALQIRPDDLMAALNLAEALVRMGDNQAALELARRNLETIDLQSKPLRFARDAGHYPPQFDSFRMEWERAGWANAGRPEAEAQAKRALFRWRFHRLLAELTGELTHYYEAALLRPELPETHSALGFALMRGNRPTAAVAHLERALALNPFDDRAARVLAAALRAAGAEKALRRLIRARNQLARAAPQQVPMEAWFAVPVPVGDELVSIIILCCNELDCTRLCLDSLLRHTRHPFELILVDNGSQDGTPAYLEEIRRRKESARVEIVRNETNLGFPAGCNQAIPRARGRYIVFLNNDTILTPSWLDGLIGWVLNDWPHIGMVGPVTNYTAEPQQIDVDYTEVTGIEAFAQRRREQFAGKAFLFPRLTGFCLLVRREALERIGGFDERYGLGFFDDDDLSERVVRAGFQLLVAADVFVHHFGSRTFARLGVDLREQLRQNFTQFENKWGAEVAGRYRMKGEGREMSGEGRVASGERREASGERREASGEGQEARGEGRETRDEGRETRDERQEARGEGRETSPLAPDSAPMTAPSPLGALATRHSPLDPHFSPLAPDSAPMTAPSPLGALATRHLPLDPHFSPLAPDSAPVTASSPLGPLATRHSPLATPFSPLATPFSPLTPRPSPLVTLCMIVKNEESNLDACLKPMVGLVDEIIVVDTGSTDRTKELAESRGARVFDFPWVDSFAAARNESLRHATGAWIFWLDADDRLDEVNRARLADLFARLGDEDVAYVMKCACSADGEEADATIVDHVRLFRNHPGLRWQHRVHEQILPALREQGSTVRWSEVVIQHVGYQESALKRGKLERDLRLLQMEHAEQPDDAFVLFNVGWVLQDLGRNGEALTYLRRSLRCAAPGETFLRKLHALLARCQRNLGQKELALAACSQGRERYPDDVELLFQEGLARRELNDRAGARACWSRLLLPSRRDHFVSVEDGLTGYKTRHNLALLCHEDGDLAEAEKHWCAAVAERPTFARAWRWLGEICLSQKRWSNLEEAATRLGQLGAALDADLLRARAHFARKEFSQARPLLDSAIARAPQKLEPRRLLARIMHNDGDSQAEEALRIVLALDPNDAEALEQLIVLLRKQNRTLDPRQPLSLDELYRFACTIPSDIHEHCPTLRALASECRHITELGTRTGISTTAFLHAQPEKLVCYDIRKYPHLDRLQALAGRTQFIFHQDDALHVDMQETDLLFIDTWHVYEQLRAELQRHAGKARRYVVLHDTTQFAEQGETPGLAGIWRAVEELLSEGRFVLKQRWENNHGLTVLAVK